MSDKLCREHGLSVVLPNRAAREKAMQSTRQRKQVPVGKAKLKLPWTRSFPKLSSFEELLSKLQAAGYEIKLGKYIYPAALPDRNGLPA